MLRLTRNTYQHGWIETRPSKKQGLVFVYRWRERNPVGKYTKRSEVIAISDDREFLAAADTAFPLVPGVPEWLSPLLAVVPGQIAALRLATLRGENVDSPTGLTKITLTR